MYYHLDFVSPADPTFFARFGHDPQLGFWAELRARGQPQPVAQYSALVTDYRFDRPLLGLLEWLAGVGAFSASALEEALVATVSPERVRMSRDAKRALRVIATLQTDAD